MLTLTALKDSQTPCPLDCVAYGTDIRDSLPLEWITGSQNVKSVSVCLETAGIP